MTASMKLRFELLNNNSINSKDMYKQQFHGWSMSIFSNDSRIGESYDRFDDLVIVISFRVGKDVMQFFCKQIFLLFFSIDIVVLHEIGV